MKKELLLWLFIEKCLKNDYAVVLLLVVESTGSSPGRQGFKMAVVRSTRNTDDSSVLHGSIGGGIMEEKLVELAKDKLQNNDFTPFLKKQIHRKDTPPDYLGTGHSQSGMICSGEQTILFYPLKKEDLKTVKTIISCLKKRVSSKFSLAPKKNETVLHLSPTLFAVEKRQKSTHYLFENKPHAWVYEENLDFKKQLYIIGGGHCSLALSELMSKLDFHIHLFDDRQGLNTFENNHFAHEKHIVDYSKIADFIPEGENIYVVIMTVGYRSDEKVIRLLLGKNFNYMGVLGSQAKADKMKQNLLDAHFPVEQVATLNIPIGLKIKSQTPMEIAVSIAAEIISLKP
jgi:xanthine dehydrogenase accessory factor